MNTAILFITIAIVLAVVKAGAPDSKSISAAIKETQVNGFEGLNLNWEAPFRFDDYVVGFRYHLGNLKKVPESLFAKRVLDTSKIVDGQATVDVDYNIDSKVLAMDAKWNAKSTNLEISASGNTENRFVAAGIKTARDVDGKNVVLDGSYDRLRNKLAGSAKVEMDDTSVQISYDNVDRDPKLKVSHKLDDVNTVAPEISLKSKNIAYGWTRQWNGGSVEAVYRPSDKVDVKWKDNGANGVWTTKAEIPIDDYSATKVSFSRDWKY